MGTKNSTLNKKVNFPSINEEEIQHLDENRRLREAVKQNDINTINDALQKGANVNEGDPNFFQETALHRAADNGYKEILELLLKKGGLANAQTSVGRSSLHQAAWNGYLDCVQVLISYAANVNMQDHWGETPLMDAAVGGHYFAARELLAFNADPNIRNDDFRTALDLVCTGENCDRKYEAVLRKELQRYMEQIPESQRSLKKSIFRRT